MARQFKAFLLDVKGKTREKGGVITVTDTLEELYRLCDCTTIDIVERMVNGVLMDIVCDDEGLFDNPIIPSAFDDEGNVLLTGNLLFCNHNDEGELTDITDEQISAIWEGLRVFFVPNHILRP